MSGFQSAIALRSSVEAVEHAEAAHFVAALAQRRDDVVLGAPLFDFLFAVSFQTLGRHQARVHHDERAQSFHKRQVRSLTLGVQPA